MSQACLQSDSGSSAAASAILASTSAAASVFALAVAFAAAAAGVTFAFVFEAASPEVDVDFVVAKGRSSQLYSRPVQDENSMPSSIQDVADANNEAQRLAYLNPGPAPYSTRFHDCAIADVRSAATHNTGALLHIPVIGPLRATIVMLKKYRNKYIDS